jgi:hypothetical protein
VFRGGRKSNDEARSMRQLNVTCVEVQKQVNRRIWDNTSVNIDETAFEISVSHGKKILTNGLRLLRVGYNILKSRTIN